MTTLTGQLRQSTAWSIVLSVLMILTGVFAILVPPIAGLTLAFSFGWLLIFTGGLHLAFAWHGERAAVVAGELALAVLYAVAGAYILSRPLAGLASLTLAVAAYLATKGVLEGAIAFKLRGLSGSGWLLFDGILTVAIAAMIAAAWPASSAWAVGTLIGVTLCFSGVARLMVSVAVRRVLA